MFDDLVRAYLSIGSGIAGMQPKIMVPDRPTVPIPSLIVKAASPSYPGLAANEYLCLQAARRAGIATPSSELSDDGQMLILDRFDLIEQGPGSSSDWASKTLLRWQDAWLRSRCWWLSLVTSMRGMLTVCNQRSTPSLCTRPRATTLGRTRGRPFTPRAGVLVGSIGPTRTVRSRKRLVALRPRAV